MFWCSKFLERTFYRLRNKPVCIIQHFPWDCSESNMIFTSLLKILCCLPDEYLNNLRMLFWRETLLEWKVLYHENILQKRGGQSKQAEKKGPWDVLIYSNTKINCLSHVWSDIRKLCYSSVFSLWSGLEWGLLICGCGIIHLGISLCKALWPLGLFMARLLDPPILSISPV